MANKISTNDQNSRYVQGGLTDVFANRLGWWDRRVFRKDATDREYIIPPEYHQRPDRLSYDIYGRTDYYFLILQFNNIIDVTEEFISGKTIMLPSASRLSMEFCNRQTGGNKV